MISIAKPLLGKEEEKSVLRVLRSGKLAQGQKVAEFEEKFAGYCGTKFAIAMDNGTSALMTALISAGVGPGDEVITTPFTFIASVNSIVFSGAKPVFVDIDPITFNLDPAKIESAINKKTKAILPVHLYGLMADMQRINKIAKNFGLIVIEDAAQAHGADIKGKRAGSWGLAGCFSFYPTKNMTTGEGGMITTNNRKFAEEARLFRNHGMEKRYYHDFLGYNFKMTEIAAAIGIEQLKKLESFTKKRIKNAGFLDKNLEVIQQAITPTVPDGYRHVFHQYTLKVSERKKLISKLDQAKVGNMIYYPIPIHKQKPYQTYSKKSYPVSEKLSKEVISIPVHPGLTKKDLEKIYLSIS